MTATSPTSLKFNPFQRIMALWEAIDPYNAGYVFQLSGRANLEAMREAVQESCRNAGVGRLVLNDKKKTYSYEPGDTVRVDSIQPNDSVMQVLGEFLTRQINAPFPPEPHHPLRWGVLDDLHGNCHFLVVVWRHLIADAVSIRLLVRLVLARYYGISRNSSQAPLRFNPNDYRQVMKRHDRYRYLTASVRASRVYGRLRYVYRMPEATNRGRLSRVLLFDTPEDFLPRLIAACRRRKVSVNDAFLAALTSAIAEITPSRQFQRRRRGLALAAAVDLRPIGEELADSFGLFVGHWVTLIKDPDRRDFDALLAEIARQTRIEKVERRFCGPELDFWTILLLRRWLGMKQDRSWYRKVYPLSAGVSNIKISRSEFPEGKEKVLACFLVPPTGPALPFVLSPATLGDRLKLSVVYRDASLSESQVQTVMNLFLRELDSLCKISKAEQR